MTVIVSRCQRHEVARQQRNIIAFNKFLVLDVCFCLSKATNDNIRGGPYIFSLTSTFARN